MNSIIVTLLLVTVLLCCFVDAQKRPSVHGCNHRNWGSSSDCRYPDYDNNLVETPGGIRLSKRRRDIQLKVVPEDCGFQPSDQDHCLVLLDIASEVSEKVCKLYSDCREILDEKARKASEDIFSNVKENKIYTFAVSLERSSPAVVDNPEIPKEFVNKETFEKFKQIVQDMKPDNPLESVVSNGIKFGNLSIYLNQWVGHTSVTIRGTIGDVPNTSRFEQQSFVIVKANVDQPSAEDMIGKLLKSASSIENLELGINKDGKYTGLKMILNDRLFAKIFEHAVNTKVENEWSMNLQLSTENIRLLRSNRTSGIFQNFKN